MIFIQGLPAQIKQCPTNSGCRYAKLTLFGCYRADKDEQEVRIGRFVTGFLANLSCPDFSWGWGRGVQSGNKITTSVTGARVATRNHSPRRSFTVKYGVHNSAADPLWLAYSLGDDAQGKIPAYSLTPNRGFGTMPIGAEFSGKTVDLSGNVIQDPLPVQPTQILKPVISFQTTVPDSPSDGDRYLVSPGVVGHMPEGAFVGMGNKIAQWNSGGGVWDFSLPADGDLVFIKSVSQDLSADPYTQPAGATFGIYSDGTWYNAWQYMAVETYQQNKRSWQELLDLFESVEINGDPLVLAFEGDLVTTEWAANTADPDSEWYRGTQIAYDPCTIMMARVKSIGRLTQAVLYRKRNSNNRRGDVSAKASNERRLRDV